MQHYNIALLKWSGRTRAEPSEAVDDLEQSVEMYSDMCAAA